MAYPGHRAPRFLHPKIQAVPYGGEWNAYRLYELNPATVNASSGGRYRWAADGKSGYRSRVGCLRESEPV